MIQKVFLILFFFISVTACKGISSSPSAGNPTTEETSKSEPPPEPTPVPQPIPQPDTTAPTVSVSAQPPAVTTETSANFIFAGQDAGSGFDKFQCRLDGASFQTCTSPQNYASLAVGNHTFTIIASDKAGNISANLNISWTVQSLPLPPDTIRLSANYTNPELTMQKNVPSVNGWFPRLTPDGKHVACGFGGTVVLEVASSQVLHQAAGGFGGSWIRPNVATYFIETASNNAAIRYEYTLGQASAVATADTQTLVLGGANNFDAADGHWVSWIPFRVAYDNRVLTTGVGGRVRVSENSVVHTGLVNGEYRRIQRWTNGVLVADYPTLTPQEAHMVGFSKGYIGYGGYGPIHGIDPSGTDIDLTVSTWGPEFNPEIFWVSGQPWVASTTTGPNDVGFILLRPWGEKKVIVIEDGDASGIHVAESNGVITVARSSVTGILKLYTIPANAKRYFLAP